MTKISIGATLASCLVMGLALCGCSSNVTSSSQTQSATYAKHSDIIVAGSQAGVTPFIATAQLSGQSVSQVSSVEFKISPMPNSVSQPVDVTWSMAALSGRGYLQNNLINLPVFGLYAGYQNQVNFQITFNDGSVQQLEYQIVTQPYTDPTGVYLSPTILQARAPGSTLGFSFFILKSLLGSPLIVDTDGQVRWVTLGAPSSAVIFKDGQFVSGNTNEAVVTSIQLDGIGSAMPNSLPQPLLSSFTHNIDPGPNGLLAEFNGTDDLGSSIGDIVAEISPMPNQPPLQVFDMADILSSYMRNNGDDPTAFVRPGIDWFHVNASTYDPSDHTVIISSRENFLIKVNYLTHDIVWIFGDPTKYWYTFPSLRAKALTLDAGGDYPVGQHGISVTSDGYVMVFNDGEGSLNQPAGESAGISRNFSEVSTYSVNAGAMTAHQVWSFDYGQSIFSPYCGSSYEAPGHTYLVDFATADNMTEARLVGLDSNHNVVFDFQYASPTGCGAAWNVIPIPLENLQIN
ncbi:MAG TPA: aryl-sulfate sulfotransferase [Terracidiphilus sp.]|nr:aryl-sulfate sulfotransferase [Terracidiphilus sp.]